MPPFLTISEAARLLGVCPKTLRRWDATGLFKPTFRAAGQHRQYDYHQIKAFTNANKPSSAARSPPPSPQHPPRQRAIVYGRVSSSLQKNRGDLDRQLAELHQYCHHQNYQLIKTLQDVGSGLNDNRKGLHQLIQAVSRGACDMVVIAYPGRLARFGINVLKTCFAEWGVTLRIVNPKLYDTSKESALISDITAILYSYMGKLYRLRRRS